MMLPFTQVFFKEKEIIATFNVRESQYQEKIVIKCEVTLIIPLSKMLVLLEQLVGEWQDMAGEGLTFSNTFPCWISAMQLSPDTDSILDDDALPTMVPSDLIPACLHMSYFYSVVAEMEGISKHTEYDLRMAVPSSSSLVWVEILKHEEIHV